MKDSRKTISLAEISVGGTCLISHFALEDSLRRRILDLGMIPGTSIECLRRGPSGDPTAYSVRGTTVAIRKEDAQNIKVYPI